MRQQCAREVQRLLDLYEPDPKVPLWHYSPYTLLIAVLLSAQATDVRVNAVTPRLFIRADTAEKMVLLTIEEIEEIIHVLGLSRRKAEAIHRLSQRLLEQFDGRVPETFEALESLPGVGHKTASCVMIHAFRRAAFPVDTHIFRCARRWGLSDGERVEEVEEDLKQLFPEEDWARLHLQMIYFARQYCPARGHDPLKCPLCSILSKPI